MITGGGGVVGEVHGPSGTVSPVRVAAVRRVRVEHHQVARADLDRRPVERFRHRFGDPAPVVGVEESRMRVRSEPQAAREDRRRVEGHHRRHVVVDEPVRRGVLMGREPAATGMLVVDLLLEQHDGFADELRQQVGDVAPDEVVELPVVLGEAFAAGQGRAIVGLLEVVHPGSARPGPVGPARRPRRSPGRAGRAEWPRPRPPSRRSPRRPARRRRSSGSICTFDHPDGSCPGRPRPAR